MSNTWDDTNELSDNGLLPTGNQPLMIVEVRERITDNGNMQAVLKLEAQDGVRGEVSVPLEPWSFDSDALDLFRSKFRTDAGGLGFQPRSGDTTIDLIARDEFLPYAHELIGAVVMGFVKHEQTDGTGRDGQVRKFTNHRVRFRGLLSRPQHTPAAPAAIDTSDFKAPEPELV